MKERQLLREMFDAAIGAASPDKAANAITALGFCAPILIGRDTPSSMALFGSKRLGNLASAASSAYATHRAPERDRAARPALAVNRLGEKGEWNLDELKIEFEELIFADAPIEVSGFTLDEIDHIVLDEADDAIEKGPLTPEAGAIAVARIGDIFDLGPHRIICGSATDPDTLRRLVGDDSTSV